MMLSYNTNNYLVNKLEKARLPQENEVCWMHFTEKTKDSLQSLLNDLNIHPLAKSALLNGINFPKIDKYQKCAFLSILLINTEFQKTQLRIIATEQYVISYADKELEVINRITEKLKHHPEYLSHSGFVLYQFLDSVAMEYLELVDYIADYIQKIEKQVFKTPFENEIGHSVYRWKVQIHELRQIVEAQEEMMKTIGHSDFPYVNEESNPYIQDTISRFSRITSALDTFKETLTNIFDLQLSLKSDHMNVIMKTLTLVSVVFLPMTFIAGLYGMNFEKMPELKWEYGYLYALLLMASLGGGIAFYFKKQGWWGEKDKHEK
jgi:magnesium transporter